MLALIHGSNVYEGTLSGSSADLRIAGRYPGASGKCIYSFDNVLEATFEGDFITGVQSFEPNTNGDPDCAALECQSVAAFNGARAPR